MAVQASLNVDDETSSLLDHGAQVLGMTREDLVASAVRAYVASRRGEIEREVRAAAARLDGSHAAKVALLSGLTPEEIEALGGL